MSYERNTQYTYSIALLGLIILDQLLKYTFSVYVNAFMLIPNLVRLSISEESKFMGWLRIDSFLFPIIAYIFILAALYWNKNFFYQRPYALVFLLSGITSNFLDRIALGYVRDYIDVRGFVSFNLADGMILMGVGLLLISKRYAF